MKAMVTGSFDPPTLGHIDIIERAAALFDSVEAVIFINRTKKYMFSLDDRVEMLTAACKRFKNVSVTSDDGLAAIYCERNNIDVIVRGVRDVADLPYEMSLAASNRSLASHPETVFLPAKAELSHVTSSFARDLLTFGMMPKDIVPPEIADFIVRKGVYLTY